jgi:hypothetical protein
VNDEKYIGLDVHQATIVVAVMDSTGKLVMESILEKLFYAIPLSSGLQERQFDLFGLERFVLILQPLQFHDSGTPPHGFRRLRRNVWHKFCRCGSGTLGA